jgi:O-phosphoseryl-tRNA(Cys) synthetase
VSEKMTCPGCGSHGSAVLMAFGDDRPCPSCGLSADAAHEIIAVQRKRADEALKAELSEALRRADRAETERDELKRKLADAVLALEDVMTALKGEGQ